MAGFMQSSESKNAARTLAVPISDVSTFESYRAYSHRHELLWMAKSIGRY
jgi:hypothetical protein